MATTHAMGFNVRHAVSRALATANLSPTEATYKVLAARAWLNSGGDVARGEVTVSIRKPRPINEWEPHEISGWVNPDGDHPGMVLARLADPIFVDVLPVTWERWLRDNPHQTLPPGADPFHPRIGLTATEAADYAARVGHRLPRSEEFLKLWGRQRFPWGDDPSPDRGRATMPRYGEVAEVGLYPPIGGVYDLGGWLWQRLADGGAAGVVQGMRPRAVEPPAGEPVGLRLVADL